MPRRLKQTIWLTGKTYPTLEVEVLYIGAHPTGYSNLSHIIVALTNEQAIEFYDRGYNVKVAEKDSKFMGVIQEEHLLYLVIDIPKTFAESKVEEYRLEQRYFGFDQATIEVVAQGWETTDGKSGVRLYLEAFSFVDKRTGLEVLKDVKKEIEAIDDYLQYVQRQRDAGGFPVLSRHAFEQQKVRGVRPYPRQTIVRESEGHPLGRSERLRAELRQKRFNNRFNLRETIWQEGDIVGMHGKEYLVSHITNLGDQWGIKLEAKFENPEYIRVPK